MKIIIAIIIITLTGCATDASNYQQITSNPHGEIIPDNIVHDLTIDFDAYGGR